MSESGPQVGSDTICRSCTRQSAEDPRSGERSYRNIANVELNRSAFSFEAAFGGALGVAVKGNKSTCALA